MQIKRFEAKNMTDALRQIKRELGPEAVILSAKDLRRENRLLGISRKIGVEVTAAIDEDYPGVVSASEAHPKPGEYGGQRLTVNTGDIGKPPANGFLHKINDIVSIKGRKTMAPEVSPSVEKPHQWDSDRNDTGKMSASNQQTSRPKTPARQDRHPISQYLTGTGLSAGGLELDPKAVNYIALVGNPGVGKTTTIAKLAAYYQLACSETVGLLSFDDRKIGGLAQIQSYADSLGLLLEAPENKTALSQAVDRLADCRVVLIDTPAHHPNDIEWSIFLKERFKAIGEVKTLMVVSAENREADLQEQVQRLGALHPSGVIVTKMDLTGSSTDVVNFLCQQSLPIHFLSLGPRVPFDLIPATMDRLAEHLINHQASAFERPKSAELDREESAGDGRVYLANKNSDIFHRPECKWIRLINQSNIVEFTSFAEALNNRFKPCRY